MAPILPDHAFAELFDRVPVALVVRSLETEAFVAVNRAYEALTGYGREELLGKTPSELGIFDPIPHHELNVLQVVLEGGIAEREASIRAKDGRVFEVVFSSARMRVAGQLVAFSILRPRSSS